MIIIPFIVGAIAGQILKRNNPGLGIVLTTPGRQFLFSIFVGLAVTGTFATGKAILKG